VFANPRIRLVEDELPDAIAGAVEETVTSVGAPSGAEPLPTS
jgi:hypothetical protein